MSAEDILAMAPDGVFLSNGPGDPAATGEYAVPVIRKLIDSGLPIFGICLGHQILALALGGTTVKMHQGHHGANHPVKDHTTGKVEIVSMNHGLPSMRTACPKVSRRPTSRCSTAPTAAAAGRKAGVLGPASPGSLARPAGQPLPVPPLHEHGR
jgi:carbamoylphosphate synthase small subunit